MRGCGQIILHYALFILHYYRFAAVAELADAPDLGSGVNDVGVQVPSAAPNLNRNFDTKLRFCFFARKPFNNGIFTKRKVSE